MNEISHAVSEAIAGPTKLFLVNKSNSAVPLIFTTREGALQAIREHVEAYNTMCVNRVIAEGMGRLDELAKHPETWSGNGGGAYLSETEITA